VPRAKRPSRPSPAPELPPGEVADIELALRRVDEYYATHLWEFCTEMVRTVDEIDGLVKPFPNKPYLEELCRAWQTYDLLGVMKSRRMFATWALCTFNYHLARFRPNSMIAMAARKEGKTEHEGSNKLVTRCWQVHEHLSPGLPACAVVRKTSSLTFPNGSVILSVGQGTDQLREQTLTSAVFDEFAFWEWAYESWKGAKPTAEGGGKIAVLSTAGPGLFERLMFDRPMVEA
jgi:hypothetical protein